MDILSHTFSGLAIGATAIHFTKVKGFKHNSFVVLICGLAAFFPDLDALSYWSGFDSSIGKWLNLKDSGFSIYHQKQWFSHHALFHSLLMAIIFVTVFFLVRLMGAKGNKVKTEFYQNRVLYLAVFSSYLIHLLEDMPTPDFVWGGVAFLFPSENYWGGKGYIWWWNNYDLFLIIFSVFVLNLSVRIISVYLSFKTKRLAGIFLLIGVSMYLRQMITRPYDFNYSGMKGHHAVWQKNEGKSKEIQKEILGEKVYGIMEAIDNEIPFWF